MGRGGRGQIMRMPQLELGEMAPFKSLALPFAHAGSFLQQLVLSPPTAGREQTLISTMTPSNMCMSYSRYT